MTEGLRSLAGKAMRSALMRFTHSPFSGAVTGAITTAILQSSSATTVATVGFVSAGLITFPAALGVIFGANIGTTVTGWLVAILGFKLNFDTVVLPLIFIGASLRLFAKGPVAKMGFALAGFGLIFVGIATMQEGMAGLTDVITPDRLPPDTLLGRLQLVALGIVITIITQSSSAGVAATLTALYAGAINFEQAAALVIGMDVGTTVTAIFAAVGGSLNAQRTGLSHVIYNLYTACVALVLMTPYTWIWEAIAPGALIQNAEIGLVAFHTSFNIFSVAAILPFTPQFAALVKTLAPGQGPTFDEVLEDAFLEDPRLALNAVVQAIRTEFLTLLSHVRAILDDPAGQRCDLVDLQSALDETHTYLDRIHLKRGNGGDWERLINLIHALDHLQRIHERCEEDEDRAITVRKTPELDSEQTLLTLAIGRIFHQVSDQRWFEAAQNAKTASIAIHRKVKPFRQITMGEIASGQIDVLTGTARLEAIRWLRRVSKHVSRITEHVSQFHMVEMHP